MLLVVLFVSLFAISRSCFIFAVKRNVCCSVVEMCYCLGR